MSLPSREALLAGLVFGLLTTGVDTFMSVVQPEAVTTPNYPGTTCLNYLLSCLMYSLAGYNAAARSSDRHQAPIAGLAAALVNFVVNWIVQPLILPQQPAQSVGAQIGGVILGLLISITMGLALGYVGGRVAARGIER